MLNHHRLVGRGVLSYSYFVSWSRWCYKKDSIQTGFEVAPLPPTDLEVSLGFSSRHSPSHARVLW